MCPQFDSVELYLVALRAAQSRLTPHRPLQGLAVLSRFRTGGPSLLGRFRHARSFPHPSAGVTALAVRLPFFRSPQLNLVPVGAYAAGRCPACAVPARVDLGVRDLTRARLAAQLLRGSIPGRCRASRCDSTTPPPSRFVAARPEAGRPPERSPHPLPARKKPRPRGWRWTLIVVGSYIMHRSTRGGLARAREGERPYCRPHASRSRVPVLEGGRLVTAKNDHRMCRSSRARSTEVMTSAPPPSDIMQQSSRLSVAEITREATVLDRVSFAILAWGFRLRAAELSRRSRRAFSLVCRTRACGAAPPCLGADDRRPVRRLERSGGSMRTPPPCRSRILRAAVAP